MTNFKFILSKLLALLAFILLLAINFTTAHANQAESESLEEISSTFEKLRKDLKIPGMALVIVKNDRVIMSKGFGFRDIEGQLPVTSETNFAIGSTTKAFTSTLIGILNDENKMSWDAKVTDYIDWFVPNLNDETGALTIRDMLSNRSGLSRNDILWANGKVSREDILRESLDSIPLDKFREKFNYNNVLFLASGMSAARAANAESWDSLVQEKIFTPLGMSSTSSIHDKAENIAFGYRWDRSESAFQKLNRKKLDNIAPAGGIYSNISDMAQWLRFNLSQGKLDGSRLLSQKQFEQLWSPAISIKHNLHYGLGWFISQWNGKKVVEHGGNILGFSAQVAMIPEEKLGFVLLTNTTNTPLLKGSMEVIWKNLLSVTEETSHATDHRELSEYTGRFVANFGSFKEAIFTVLVNQKGELSLDVPGQRLYALKRPNEEGKWFFKMTNKVAISFEQFRQDKPNILKMYQNDMVFELPREGYKIEPEMNLARFKPLLGAYVNKNLPRPIQALISNNRLAIDVPGEMVYELKLPVKDGHRTFRINSKLSAKFTVNDNGDVTALSVFKNRRKVLSANRVQANDIRNLPTTDEILSLIGSEQKIAAYRKWGPTTITAKISMLQAGVQGAMTMHYDNDDKFIQHLDFGAYGKVSNVLNGDYAATMGFEPLVELRGPLLEQARAEHPLSIIDLKSFYDSIQVIGRHQVDGLDTYLVELKRKDLPITTLSIDAKTGDILERKVKLLVRDAGAVPFVISYRNFELKDGVRIPKTINLFNPMNGNMLIEYQSFEVNEEFNESVFSLGTD